MADANSSGWASRALALVERLTNHVVMIAALAVLLAQLLEIDHDCPIVALHSALVEEVQQPENNEMDIDAGIAYHLPPEALLVLGSILASIGAMMLIFGGKMQQFFSASIVVSSLALAAQEVAVQTLLLQPKSERFFLNLTLSRGATPLSSLKLDVACTAAFFAILIAISTALHFVALRMFKRMAQFFEGAITAVLTVRLVAQFLPWLLVSHPFSGADYVGHMFLGYPLVPFWAIALPLAFILGALEPVPCLQAIITCFLGAFAATKGIRTIQDYLVGADDIELAGGDDVHSDPLQGMLQLGLFAVGLLIHQKVWLQNEGGREHGFCGGVCGCCGCCGCGEDEDDDEHEEPREQERRPNKRVSQQFRGNRDMV
mmetsp:Transcript_37896/g.100220  ORF Transcript_37896/g.100220 Transcript_37896/m.100220 type:complete len:373 (+) Transcript_37896:30-1148(+)|eukprot:CAMPEP_0115846722 /NCGR_PEP_ID=MMETSP0287-20121206/10006_1 /TAXON_ID=412157 /ORGANISM="Chrysochromulina rotalis, Strain UIO044" /LENGTH=372 /DNA_ID=CAMNT_0003300519 /DNA_START=30 /DNA_END=1148 /DNA_ORIENTATION=+